MTLRSIFGFVAFLLTVPFLVMVQQPQRCEFRAYIVNHQDVYAGRTREEAIKTALADTHNFQEVWPIDEIYEVSPSTLIDWGLTGHSTTTIEYELGRMHEPGQVCGVVLLRQKR